MMESLLVGLASPQPSRRRLTGKQDAPHVSRVQPPSSPAKSANLAKSAKPAKSAKSCPSLKRRVAAKSAKSAPSLRRRSAVRATGAPKEAKASSSAEPASATRKTARKKILKGGEKRGLRARLVGASKARQPFVVFCQEVSQHRKFDLKALGAQWKSLGSDGQAVYRERSAKEWEQQRENVIAQTGIPDNKMQSCAQHLTQRIAQTQAHHRK